MNLSSESPQPDHPAWNTGHRRSWIDRFVAAGRGIWQGVRGQPTFWVHIPVATAVIVAALLAGAETVHWCLLAGCIGAVLTAELFNSAVEWGCRAITDRYDEKIGRALDIASGAVLLASATAAVVGILVFLDLLMTSGS